MTNYAPASSFEPAVFEGLIHHLEGFLLEERLERMKRVISQRTSMVTLALENIYQPHNASACLRSADVFGLSAVHIMENYNRYELNPQVTMGAVKWLTLNRYPKGPESTQHCLQALKQQGFRIAVASMEGAVSIHDYAITQPTALLFGTELEGVTEEALAAADDRIFIPMDGFTESLNISVSVGITLSHLLPKLRQSEVDWKLPKPEHDQMWLTWLRKSIRRAPMIEAAFVKQKAHLYAS